MADDQDAPASGECRICDAVWATVAILGALAVAFMAFDVFSNGKLTEFIGARVQPRLAELKLLPAVTDEGVPDDGDVA